MRVDVGISHQTMTSRINYNAPLKSVRTVRALKIDQYEPPKRSVDDSLASGDPARPSDADLMSAAGIAFVWENAPGHSKIEQEKATPVELKPPPQQALTPPPSSKVSPLEENRSPPPAAGTPDANAKSYSVDTCQVSSSAGHPGPKMKLSSIANHQLPPKSSQRKSSSVVTVHQQSGDSTHCKPRKMASLSAPDSGHSVSLLRNGTYAHQSGYNTPETGCEETPMTKELTARIHACTSEDQAIFRGCMDRAPHSALNRGNQHYLAERLLQAPMQGGKNFYYSGRSTPAGTVPNSTYAIVPHSLIPTRPNSGSASEAGSHSDEDWDGDQTDVGDESMYARDQDARCEVSVLDGEQHDTSRHTDPSARDFIMERFLPAAKAMVTETMDACDRRSSQETASVSPTRGKGRPSLPGRSRFAFKDRFVGGNVEEKEVDESDMLFKCKFPWQMGALTATGPRPRSLEQSPSSSFRNRPESSSELYDGELQDAAWIHADSEGIAVVEEGDSRSFESRRLPPKPRNKNCTSAPKGHSSRIGEIDSYDSSRAFSLSEESMNGEYFEGEYSCRSIDARARVAPGVLKDKLDETVRRDWDNGINGHAAKRLPEFTFSGSLGTLLRTTHQQRRDLGRNSGVSIDAAVVSVHEPIPPSSILNHHRNKPTHTAAKSPASDSPNSRAKLDDESDYPKHLKVDLVRQLAPEPSGASGRSLQSINGEVWEASGRQLSPALKFSTPEDYDRAGLVLTTHHSDSLDYANDDTGGAIGWPLAKAYTSYARTPSSDSKDASFSSLSEHSLRSPSNQGSSTPQEKSSSEKYSPVSVLQPPLPKSPSESWLFKVRPRVPPSMSSNWQGTNQSANFKKSLEYSLTDDEMDVKWEDMVKSESAQLQNKLVQEVQRKVPGLDKSKILGSKAR